MTAVALVAPTIEEVSAPQIKHFHVHTGLLYSPRSTPHTLPTLTFPQAASRMALPPQC